MLCVCVCVCVYVCVCVCVCECVRMCVRSCGNSLRCVLHDDQCPVKLIVTKCLGQGFAGLVGTSGHEGSQARTKEK